MIEKLIVIMLAVTSVGGCATSGPEIVPIAMPREQFDKLGMKIDQSSIMGKAWEKAKNNGVERERQLQPQFTEAQAKDAYKYLCKGGKPVKKIDHQFRYVLPKVPVGVTLADAKRVNASILTLMRAHVASFYRLLAFGRADERIQRVRVGPSSTADMRSRGPFPYYLIKKAGTSKETVESLKSLSANPNEDKVTRQEDPVLIMMKGIESNLTPILIEIAGKKPEYLASVIDIGMFGKLGITEFAAPPSSFTEAMPYELWAIREHFLLAVSSAEIDSWSLVAGKRTEGNLDPSLEAGDPKQGSPLPHDKLISDRKKIFSNYLVANTSIDEGTTNDGQVFTFAVALNTEPLCRLGRPAQEFLSK
jgi:hypothetical protein